MNGIIYTGINAELGTNWEGEDVVEIAAVYVASITNVQTQKIVLSREAARKLARQLVWILMDPSEN